MTREELEKILKENRAEALEILNIKDKAFTLQDFKEFYEKDDQAKRFVKSEIDRAVTKGIETWKENNLQAEVDRKVKELYPEESEDQKELKKLRAEFETLKGEKKREEITNRALRKLHEKNLPQDLIKHLNIREDQDPDETIETFTKTLEGIVDTRVKTQLKKFSRNDIKDFQKTGEDVDNPYKVNPWDKSAFNLTLQGKIQRENPELATYLRSIAKKE